MKHSSGYAALLEYAEAEEDYASDRPSPFDCDGKKARAPYCHPCPQSAWCKECTDRLDVMRRSALKLAKGEIIPDSTEVNP